MKRKLNIACAIVHRPELIVMDEPTVGIDPEARRGVLDLVRLLSRWGATVIYSSHYLEEVEALCARVGILDRGRLLACGTIDELRAMVGEEQSFRIVLNEGNDQALQELRAHPGIVSLEGEPAAFTVKMRSSESYLQDVLYILSKHKLAVRTMERLSHDLESMFLSITAKRT
jgi:ABC-2 type transport system ATP-binding protein